MLSCNPEVQNGLSQNAAVFHHAVLAQRDAFWGPLWLRCCCCAWRDVCVTEKGKITEYENNIRVKVSNTASISETLEIPPWGKLG